MGIIRKLPGFRDCFRVVTRLLLVGLVCGCASASHKTNYDNKQSSGKRQLGSPLLWTGEGERHTMDIDAEGFNEGTHVVGTTKVDYIGSLNSDGSYAGSPAQTAELRLIRNAGGGNTDTDGQLSVEFRDDPLDYFVQQMLGGFLGLNYVVSGQLAGTVSFKTEVPIARSQVLPVVRSILAQNGYVLKLIGGVFHIATPQIAEQTERTTRAGSQGDRVTRVFKLPEGADQSISESLRAILPPSVSVAFSQYSNSLILQANAHEIGDIEQLISTLLQGKAENNLFAVIYVNHSPPENVAAKLMAFFASQSNTGNKLPISIIPLEERQALLVSANSRTAIENVRKLASQLDFGLTDEVALRIIPLRHLTALNIAEQLNAVFGGGAGRPTISTTTTGMASPEIAKDTNLPQSGNTTSPSNEASATADSQQGISSRVAQAFDERPESRISIDSSVEISIVADERNNVLLVRSSYRNFKRIREAVRTLDVPLSQVVIEATILEVKITDALRYGVQWFLSGNGFTMRSSNSNSQEDQGLSGLAATVEQLVSGVSVNAVIDALDDVTEVSVISTPYLTVMNQKTARLVVGDQIPFSTKSQSASSDGDVAVTQEISIKDTGVIMEVQPIIRANNSIELHIVNELSSAELQSGEVNLTPTITTRQITSDIIVHSGHTVLLGGLIQDRTEQQKTGIPLLRKTPIIGRLFEQTNNSDIRTEVVVLITPRVARSSSEIEQITNTLRHHMNLPQPYSGVPAKM
jgi:general secretion pathway protein D